MKPLPSTLRRAGAIWRVVERQANLVLIREGSRERYHVAKVKQVKAKVFPGASAITPAYETLPSPSRWGTEGWSFNSLTEAEAKFAEKLNGLLPVN